MKGFRNVIMDVMRPRLTWINDRCYRVYGDEGDYVPDETDLRGYGDTADAFRSDSPMGMCDDVDDLEEDYDIIQRENGLFEHSFHVPKSLYPLLIGSKGSTRMRLEKESKAKINIPSRGADDDIVLTAPKRNSIVIARRRIDLMVLSARQRQPFTHFLSIPMTALKDQFINFKERVLSECKSRGVDEDIFQEPSKLHLTLGTLTLFDDVDRSKATDALYKSIDEVINPILNGRPVTVRMQGIEYMNDDPAEVDVLYGCVNDLSGEDILQTLADSVVQYFVRTGLMPKQHERVKLHVTLLNTRFRRSSIDEDDTARTGERRKRQCFDATPILRNFLKEDFGEAELERIDISQRYTTAENGYYSASASVPIM